ncbi:MAG TPA: hypothetical protein DCO89_00990 [Clostridiales bacterium]|nr:hypothetical protein [Clostridiales bacterium]
MDKKKGLIKKALLKTALIASPIFVCGTANYCNNAYKGRGLNQIFPGNHLRAGEHKVVFTEQFWDVVKKDTEEYNFKMAINGINEAFNTLNELNSGINFKVCTNCDYFVDYGFEKVDDINQHDIILKASNGYLKSSTNGVAVGLCKSITLPISGENVNCVISFCKDSLFTYWDDGTEEIDYMNVPPKNTVAYSLALHEAMHAMGFNHNDFIDSVMYPCIDFNHKDLGVLDKKLIDAYNVRYYGAESKYKHNEALTNSKYFSSYKSECDDELEM